MESPFFSFKVNVNANNSLVKSLTRHNFELIRDFMPVLVTCKFDKDQTKGDLRKRGDTILPIICQRALSVAMVNTVLILSAPEPNAAFPHPKDATDKI